jgi:hypothetical protein
MPYLRVPNSGWDGIVDTGFGNRIQYWEIAYALNKFNSFKFIILVDANKWKETKFLNFPYTESSNFKFNNLKDLPEIDARYPWLRKLDTNESWDIIDEWPPYQEGDGSYGKWLHLITLKDKVLEKKIKEVVKDRIAIHIRHWTSGEIFRSVDPRSDSGRFNSIKKMNLVRKTLDKFPNSKFYVSTDVTYNKPSIGPLLPDFRKDLHWVSEIYRDYDVVDYRDIMSVDELLPTVIKDENNTKWSKIYDTEGEQVSVKLLQDEDLEAMEINKIYDGKSQRDVIDLFSLIYSKEFISSSKTGPYSSWSEFVEVYRKKL